MPEKHDFERAWLVKFANCLEEVAGEEIREQVMAGSEGLSAQSDRQQVIDWSRQAMERLDALVDPQGRKEIMTGCACQYPKSQLQEIKRTFAETQDLDLAHRMLQEQFEAFLEDTLQLDGELVQEIVARGWGAAGIKEGNTIIATKIPKSGFLVEYMNETDPQEKRRHYCHCPRVRDVLRTQDSISTTYCYCGAGFYKGIWEEILGEPVEVELLQSVLKGDDVCQIAIELPWGT
jgi:predicted hydrocarbon binding protein